eukprot:SAG11_NODE_23348_length_390_cov_1.000000_1_plen_77_part_01
MATAAQPTLLLLGSLAADTALRDHPVAGWSLMYLDSAAGNEWTASTAGSVNGDGSESDERGEIPSDDCTLDAACTSG